MNSNLRAAIIAAGLVGVTLSTAGITNAAAPGNSNSTGAPGVALNPGEVAAGYSDGYWDHSRAWHAWQSQDDMQSYKSAQNSQYHDWNHTRDPDQGWNLLTLNFGDVAFGYSDGYWDHGHQWHAWRNQDDMHSYKSAQNTQFHDWNHTRDPDQGWTQQ